MFEQCNIDLIIKIISIFIWQTSYFYVLKKKNLKNIVTNSYEAFANYASIFLENFSEERQLKRNEDLNFKLEKVSNPP